MLFWSPDQLPYLYPYPDAHLLRRRSRVNMHAQLEQLARRFPLLQRRAAAAPRQALLEPGDVVFFPSRLVGAMQGQQVGWMQAEVQVLCSCWDSPAKVAGRFHICRFVASGPCRWAHYTESLDFSMSVTCRFQFS
jgi:hypothetical protein